jgi:hypothetical protein
MGNKSYAIISCDDPSNFLELKQRFVLEKRRIWPPGCSPIPLPGTLNVNFTSLI